MSPQAYPPPQTDTGWQSIVFGAGWSRLVLAGYPDCQARRIGHIVLVRGTFTKATAWAANDTCGSLPEGMAPTARVVLASNGVGVVAMPDGSLIVTGAGAAGNSFLVNGTLAAA